MKSQLFSPWLLSLGILAVVIAPFVSLQAADEKAPPAAAAPPATEAAPKTPPAEAPKTAAPAAEAPKADAPKTEPPKAETPKTEAPKTEAPKTEAPKAEPGKEPAKPPVESPAAATAPGEKALAFEKKLEAWKDVLKKLRSLQKKSGAAEENEIADLQKQWDDLLAQGNKLVPEVRAAAQAAFVEAPNMNREVTRFLVKNVKDDIDHDDFEAALALSKAMLDAKCQEKELLALAGAAAFATHDFDTAEKYFTEATATGGLENVDPDKMKAVLDYKELWKKEQEILAKEKVADDLPRVKFETNKGTLVIELFENEAPQTVGNFVNLVEKGFYNGLTFHRVLPGFMAQGGDPQGTGTGGPGYKIYDELKEPYRRHFRGYLSMANSGPDTGGSQFFLTFLPTPHLNGKHTVFGRVIEGMDVLAKLQRRDPDSRDAAKVEPDKIIKAEVVRKRGHEYVPVKIKAD